MLKKSTLIICTIEIFILLIVLKINCKKAFQIDKENLVALGIVSNSQSFPERGKYYVEVNCENGFGKWLAETWELAIEDISGNVSCDIDFIKIDDIDSNITLKNQIESSVGPSGDGYIVKEGETGYRYEGKNPNNYIWFNNQMWRIIGSIPACLESNCGNSPVRLVKIISEESLPSDNLRTGNWDVTNVYKMLNGCYYGKKGISNSDYDINNTSTLCSTYCSSTKCDYSFNGISSLENDYYGSMIQDVYWTTSSSSNYNYASSDGNYSNDIANQTSYGKIGIMNLSDYLLATSFANKGEMLLKYYYMTTNKNWLFSRFEESLIFSRWRITGNGGIIVYTGNYYESGRTLRPVIYLKSTVFVVSGDGSEKNPYQIAKE